MLDEQALQNAPPILLNTDPLLVLAALTAAGLVAWFCVHRYRNTNDFARSVRLYLPAAAGLAVLFWLLGLPFLFSVGAAGCGFVLLMLISNYYFYH